MRAWGLKAEIREQRFEFPGCNSTKTGQLDIAVSDLGNLAERLRKILTHLIANGVQLYRQRNM